MQVGTSALSLASGTERKCVVLPCANGMREEPSVVYRSWDLRVEEPSEGCRSK